MKRFNIFLLSIITILTLSACGSSPEDKHGFSSMTFPTYKKMTIEEFTDLFDEKAFEFYEEENRVIFEGNSSNLLYKGEVIGLTTYLRQDFDSEGTPSKFHIELVTDKKPDHNGTIGGRIEYISNYNNNLTKFYATKFNTSGSNEGQYSNKEANRQFHKVIESVIGMLKSERALPEKITSEKPERALPKKLTAEKPENTSIEKAKSEYVKVLEGAYKGLSEVLLELGASKEVIDFCWDKYAPNSEIVMECGMHNIARGVR